MPFCRKKQTPIPSLDTSFSSIYPIRWAAIEFFFLWLLFLRQHISSYNIPKPYEKAFSFLANIHRRNRWLYGRRQKSSGTGQARLSPFRTSALSYISSFVFRFFYFIFSTYHYSLLLFHETLKLFPTPGTVGGFLQKNRSKRYKTCSDVSKPHKKDILAFRQWELNCLVVVTLLNSPNS